MQEPDRKGDKKNIIYAGNMCNNKYSDELKLIFFWLKRFFSKMRVLFLEIIGDFVVYFTESLFRIFRLVFTLFTKNLYRRQYRQTYSKRNLQKKLHQ